MPFFRRNKRQDAQQPSVKEPSSTESTIPPASSAVQSIGDVVVDHAYRLAMSWDLDLDITSGRSLSKPAARIPLKGTWALKVKHAAEKLTIDLRWGTKPTVGLYGDQAHLHFKLSWFDDQGEPQILVEEHYFDEVMPRLASDDMCATGACFSVSSEDWSAAEIRSQGRYKAAQQRKYRVEVVLSRAGTAGHKPSTGEAEELATRLAGLHLEHLPHNVRLFFPLGPDSGHELWVNGNMLSRSSPYFIDLFSSSFAESKVRTGRSDAQNGDTERVVIEKDFDDSDDETDEVLFANRPHLVKRSSAVADLPFRQITITQTAFSTYHAVLIYLQTGFISFAPLSSSFPSTDPSAMTRAQYLQRAYAQKPSLPLPVSPKSVYRLAHLLQLNDLQKLAFEAFRSALTTANLAQELFTDTSLAYDDLRAVIVEEVKKKWKTVKESEAWKEKVEAIKRDEITGGGTALVELLQLVASM